MGGKTKYVLVRLASVITGTSRIWLRERAAEKSAEILYDPTLGRNVLFKESETVKGKATLPPHVKKKFNLT